MLPCPLFFTVKGSAQVLVTFGRAAGVPSFTLWLLNIAMENGPFIDGLAIKNADIFHGYVK
jgi:hypothetical protein